MSYTELFLFPQVPKEKCRALLVQAITNILTKCKTGSSYRLVSVASPEQQQEQEEIKQPTAEVPSETQPEEPSALSPSPSPSSSQPTAVNQESDESDFHNRLVVTTVETAEQVATLYGQHFEMLSDRFGVLLLLYSVILTRGVENIKAELNDVTEPLIDNTYGYGSQSLINLMLTGSATAHVFDNFEDVGGLSESRDVVQLNLLFIALSLFIRATGNQ